MLFWKLNLIVSTATIVLFGSALLPADAAPLLLSNSIIRVHPQGKLSTPGIPDVTSPSSFSTMSTSVKESDALEKDMGGKVQAVALTKPISQQNNSLKRRFISYPFDGLVESIALVSITVLIVVSVSRFCEKRREEDKDEDSPEESQLGDREGDSYRLEQFTP